VSTAPPVPPGEPWPYLVVLLGPGASRRVVGLGFLVDERHVVTNRAFVERAEAVILARAYFLDARDAPEHRIGGVLATDERLAVLALAEPLGPSAEVAPPIRAPGAGEPCAVAVVDDDRPQVRIQLGDIREPRGDDFTVELATGLAEYRSAMGSPVVCDDAVVGIVGSTGTNRSVDALGLAGLPSLLPAAADVATKAAPPDDEAASGAEADVSVAFGLQGGTSSDAVDPTLGIPLAHDQLGIGVYVGMLATLIADSGTPPVSIGLFGEWGAGKSYFMGLLREQVSVLTRSPGGRYHTKIIQIGFNAWHYSDANLWASLGAEIWRVLAGREATAGEERAQLFVELEKASEQRAELDQATRRAEAETARLSASIASAGAARRTSTRELLDAAAKTAEKEPLDDVWRRLGVRDEVERGRLLADALRGVEPDLRQTRRALARRGALFAAVAIVVAAFIAGLGLLAETGAARWLTSTGALGVLGAGLAPAVRAVERTRGGLEKLRNVADDIGTTVDAERAEQSRSKVAQAIDDLRYAEARERVLRAQRDEVVAHVAELGQQLAALSPGQRLYALVSERAASDDYRRHLSLISTVRRDFEELDRRLKDWPADSAPPIERIVLYIDDLDRCTPRQVVQVLQAVHLLVGLRLFVVVVGVDPRWLVRSLHEQYRNLLGEVDGPADEWQASPEDYLEKIVNVPFVLPRMSKSSFRRLLASFAGGPDAGATPLPDPPPPGDEAPAPDRATEPGGTNVGADRPVQLEAEERSEVAAAQAGLPSDGQELRPLTAAELDFLAVLDPLVETPREVVRLMNVYRMIRSTRNLSEASSFLGDEVTPGEYQAVAILLGIASGHARLLAAILAAPADESTGAGGGLCFRPESSTWVSFAGTLRPRLEADRWVNGVVGPIDEHELVSWRRLADGLAPVSLVVTLPDLAAFQRWAPRVARFTFMLSAYAIDLEGAGAPGPSVSTGATLPV
jgi:KAP family P-loop domain